VQHGDGAEGLFPAATRPRPQAWPPMGPARKAGCGGMVSGGAGGSDSGMVSGEPMRLWMPSWQRVLWGEGALLA